MINNAYCSHRQEGLCYNVFSLRPPGLSEVVGGLGIEKLHKLMPDIIQTSERSDIAPHVRDGYIMMYIYLPSVFGDEFLTYVGPIIPSILQVTIAAYILLANYIATSQPPIWLCGNLQVYIAPPLGQYLLIATFVRRCSSS